MAKVKLTRTEKALAIGLVILALVAGVAVAFTVVNNPRAADASYTEIWKDSGAALIADIHTATISGVVSADIKVSPSIVLEAVNMQAYGIMAWAVPYWVASISLEVYKKGTSTLVYSTLASKPSGYDDAVTAYYASWSSIMTNPLTDLPHPVDGTAPAPGAIPDTWHLSWNTASVANGEYDVKIVARWLTNSLLSGLGVPANPPSLASSSGSVVFNIFSVNNGKTTGDGEPEPIDPIIASVALVVLVVGIGSAILLRKK